MLTPLRLSWLRLAFHSSERNEFLFFYRNHIMGDFIADLVVQEIVVELKAVESLVTAHSVQVVNYLSAMRLEFRLLLNFGAKSLQFKTKTREYKPQ